MGGKLPGRLTIEGLTDEVHRALVRVAIRAAKRVLTRPDQERDVEEAVNDADLALFEQLEAGETVYRPGAFISRVARRRAIDCLRRHTLQAELERQLKELAGIGERVDQGADAAGEVEQRLQRLLDRLPEKQWQCLELRLNGKSEEEIAMTLGITVGTVKRHLHRARAAIRQELG